MDIAVIMLTPMQAGAELKYNAQDLGLAKAFAKLGHKTQVIRYEHIKEDVVENISENLVFKHYSVKCIHQHMFSIEKSLPLNVDFIVCFSDIQYAFKSVVKHCHKYNIKLFPYIGVIHSTNSNPLIKEISNCIAKRNIKLYRSLTTLAKTEVIKSQLVINGVKDVHLAPVCLDISRMKKPISEEERMIMRRKYGFKDDEKVLLFVGRLTQGKQPMDAVHCFVSLCKSDDLYRLLLIGNGELKNKIKHSLQENKVDQKVIMLEDIPNVDMWKYYSIADCSLNFNREEIFGMSILEAMYYSCPVVAYAAPGPKMIISDKINGYLFSDIKDAENLIVNALEAGRLPLAHQTIINKFLWISTANTIINLYVKCKRPI